jgi:uncharacterized protein (TIGR02266 family)
MAFTARALEFGSITRIQRVPRLTVDLLVGACTEHNFWTGLARNLARGGVFVATHNVAPVGTLVELKLTIAGEEVPTPVLAQIRSIVPYSGEDIPPGWILQFVDIDAAAIAMIRSFVANVRSPLFFDVD